MSKEKQLIQIKCIVKCPNCGREQGILSVFTHSREDFSQLSYKEFFNIAENNYDKFEKIIKETLSTTCEGCRAKTKIIEILDMQYI